MVATVFDLNNTLNFSNIMVRNIFRTAAIGMVAVAGLFMLFFVLRMLLFFFIAGFIVRAVARRWAHQHPEYGYGNMQPAPASIGQGPSQHFRQPFAQPTTAPQTAIVEIYR